MKQLPTEGKKFKVVDGGALRATKCGVGLCKLSKHQISRKVAADNEWQPLPPLPCRL